ncbi:HlyD family efflux transporter periplasmic adaptor subunit, partial [Rhodovulum sulfidophilum]|nr:HlyD family efflux transporter periplasmic adaptor subunit [Rhodovulum sulfidophilum]
RAARADVERARMDRSTAGQLRLAEVAEQLAAAGRQLPGLEAQIRATRDVLERRTLRAPQAGLVVEVPTVTPGAVIGSGTAVMEIVPDLDHLVIQMRVPPEAIARLDVADHSAHWQRTQAFMAIVAPMFGADAPDAQALARMAVERIAARWAEAPPDHPVIVAGSTGSRGTTSLFMQAVARLPQGALVLPGFDFDLPAAVWEGMDDALTAEDHPQFRFHRLMGLVGAGPAEVGRWTDEIPPSPARNRLISLSL